MRLFASIGIILLVVVLQSHCQQDQDLTIGPTRQNLDLVSRSVTNLAQKISLAIASPKSKTELFSPVSIAGALSLLLLGSGGTTRDELTNLLGFQGQPISFTDIHKSFGRLFEELVSNEPSMMTRIPWRENDKCNNPDEDEEDEPSYQPSKAPSNQENRNKRDADKPVEINVGNGIFATQGREFDKKYQLIAEKLYNINTQYLDFENHTQSAIRAINEWVKLQTRGRIPEIVSHLNTDTMLVIANTLYLKAEWEVPFLRDGTKPRQFYPDGPKNPGKDVPTMVHGGCFPYFYWKDMKTKVIGIPYKQNNTMYVFMPDESTRDKVRTLQKEVNAAAINNIISRMVVKTANVHLPKMHLQNSFNLKQVLEQLGASNIFSRENSDLYRVLTPDSRSGANTVEDVLDLLEDTRQNAEMELRHLYTDCIVTEKDVDNINTCLEYENCRYGGGECICCAQLSKGRKRRQISEDKNKRPLYVNEVVHKVDVDVNEKGTEGGAVTATLLDRITPSVNFKANGPFLMLIRDETTQLPLFYGAVYDPSS
ncbi:serine protease inhibitor 28Dc-like isoform X3 [Ochlerotatus camptorhynchus]|uniref:serine protease inhibitor 28Dc-like isoform X3 n=1 Tax=Ochlerotatus camptorhynchus TaxID=644619 RepID=UPI0031DAF405